jgi:hypothetical protein
MNGSSLRATIRLASLVGKILSVKFADRRSARRGRGGVPHCTRSERDGFRTMRAARILATSSSMRSSGFERVWREDVGGARADGEGGIAESGGVVVVVVVL